MTRFRLAHRDVLALTLAAVVLGGLIGGFRGLSAWWAWRAEAVQAAADRTIELEKTLAAIARVSIDLDSAEVRVARFREVGTALLVAEHSAEAIESLEAVIRESARLSSVHVEAIASRVDTTAGGVLHVVESATSASGDVAGLASILERLEGHEILLTLRELSISPQSVETPDDAVEILKLRFTVAGLALVTSTSEQDDS